MATLSRGFGLGLSVLAPRAPLTTTQPFPRRLFTSSSTLRYAVKSKSKAQAGLRSPATASKTPTNAVPKAGAYKPQPRSPILNLDPKVSGLLMQLSNKRSPTLLYESSSHFWMKLSAWSAATMFYAYAGINCYTIVLAPSPDLSVWVPYAFGLICLATTGFGSYFLFAANNIVKSIRAVPTATLAKGLLPHGANPAKTPIHLEFQVKKLLPGRLKTIIVDPARVSIPRPLSIQTPPRSGTQAGKAAAAAAAKKEWEYDQKHLLTVPFRHAGKGMRAAMFGLQRALTRTGFMKVNAGEQQLKLDVASGWALEEGRVIDRLVQVGQ